MATTEPFRQELLKQFDYFYNEVLLSLVKFSKCSFTLDVKVDSGGSILFDDIDIVFSFDCKGDGSTYEKFKIPFNTVTPFAEYTENLTLIAYSHKIVSLIAEVKIELENLIDVMTYPLAGPRVRKDWIQFIQTATIVARKEGNLEIKLPVHDGEITWDVPQEKVIKFSNTVKDLRNNE